MARKKKKQLKIVGLVLLVIGVGLAIWGYQLSGSMGSQLTKALSGSPTDRVMMMYIGGAAAVAAGLFLLSKK
jgi:hypothetical protein